MTPSFDLKTPDFFTVGTIGPVGQRTFYLQAREGRTLATLKTEKEQVGALAEYLEKLLQKLPPATAAAAIPDVPEDLSLLEPITPAWAVGSLGVGYDEAADRILIVAEEVTEADDEEEAEDESEVREETPAAEAAAEPELATARVRVSREQAAAFVARARALVEAGRKSCVVCGRPMDPAGHVCPRGNGHGRD